MSAQHTPGPWRFQFSGPTSKYVAKLCPLDAAGKVSGPAFASLHIGRDDIQVANARLIEAAPDLYDACNALLGLLQLVEGRDDLTPDLRELLRTNHRRVEAEEAVAKAEGT